MNKSQLFDHLRTIDEVLLLELLEITSSDLVDVFYDKIIERYDYIQSQLEDPEV